jgi:integrase
VFFTVVGATPTQVNTADVLRFIEAQRQPRNGNVVRLVDGEAGMAASTIKRRLASVSSLFDYLSARGLVVKNPVPRSLSARPGRAPLRGGPLVRAPRRLPRILSPDEVDRLVTALRTERDKAMVWLIPRRLADDGRQSHLPRPARLGTGQARELRGPMDPGAIARIVELVKFSV